MNIKSDVLIIGGGIFGCAAAYYYQRDHPDRKVILLERNELCNAATSRAAALMTIVRAKQEFIPLSLETYAIIPELEDCLGDHLGIRKVGALHIAKSEQTRIKLKELLHIASLFNQPYELLSAGEAMQKSPWLQLDDRYMIAYMPGEAYCDPYLLGSFFARAAKKLGAHLRQNVEVTRLKVEKNKIIAVETVEGIYEADQVILATGAWSPILCKTVGIQPPMAPVRSQYWITQRDPILFPANSPIVIIPEANTYARPESGSLLFGTREKNGLYISPDHIPNDIQAVQFSKDRGMNDLESGIKKLAEVFPAVMEVGIQFYIAGLCGYTPDNYLTLGRHQSFSNLSIAAGCVGAGISTAGGVGKVLAALASGGSSPYDISAFDLHRYGDINIFDSSWLQRCADARSVKESG